MPTGLLAQRHPKGLAVLVKGLAVLVKGSAVLVALLSRLHVLLVGAAAIAGAAAVAGAAVAAMGVFAALAADLRHVLSVLADGLAALAAGLTGLFGVELVGGALLVRGLTALAGDAALLVVVHRSKASAICVVCHTLLLPFLLAHAARRADSR